ncbi:Uncharacterised protein [Mycobacterium tuberculosis]|nr:Uncharacterised protein [Mycobacterium tuberculosis]
MQTISGDFDSSFDLASLAGRPKPFMKPLWRCAPTGWPGSRSSATIFAGLPAIAALAYSPISTPAV